MNAYDGRTLQRITRQRVLAFTLGVAALGVLFGPSLLKHVARARSGQWLNDDAQQQIWPFLRFYTPGAFQSDYLADYQLALNPLGWDALYRWTAPWIDPRITSALLPYGLLLVTLIALGLTTWRLAGYAAAWGCVALCLSADTYLEELSGGLPRAFGYPLIALATCGLVFRRSGLLALVCCLGAATYYPIALLGSGVLALQLGLRHDLPLRRRVALLAGSALLAGLLLVPGVLALRSYKPGLGPSDWATYPEASPTGRLGGEDTLARTPLSAVLDATGRWLTAAVRGSDEPLFDTLRELGGVYADLVLGLALCLATLGYAQLCRHERRANQLWLLPLAAYAAYGVAWLLVPHLYVPERYLKFVVPPLVAIGIPAGTYWLAGGTRRPRTAAVASLLTCLLLIALLGSRGSPRAGLTVELAEEHAPLYAFLRALPEHTVIAGWPETLDTVPLATGRQVLLSRELHLPFHAAYVRETRARMNALMAAYFARELGPLRVLQARWGVTHLLIDRVHFADEPPRYFAPFDRSLATHIADAANAASAPVVLAQPQAAVFDAEGILVLDLQRLFATRH